MTMARDMISETRSDRSSRRAGAPVRALVTGATGFIGSHLAVDLARRGHDVSVLVRGNGAATAEERFSRILDWFETDGAIRKRRRVQSAPARARRGPGRCRRRIRGAPPPIPSALPAPAAPRGITISRARCRSTRIRRAAGAAGRDIDHGEEQSREDE